RRRFRSAEHSFHIGKTTRNGVGHTLFKGCWNPGIIIFHDELRHLRPLARRKSFELLDNFGCAHTRKIEHPPTLRKALCSAVFGNGRLLSSKDNRRKQTCNAQRPTPNTELKTHARGTKQTTEGRKGRTARAGLAFRPNSESLREQASNRRFDVANIEKDPQKRSTMRRISLSIYRGQATGHRLA